MVTLPTVAIREGEWPLFTSLTQKERVRILVLEGILKTVDRAGNKRAALRDAAAANSHLRGLSEGSIRADYYRWVGNNRNLMSLARGNCVQRATLARRLVKYFKAHCERNQRSSAVAYDQMMRDIRAGARIEGVGDWRDMWTQSYPAMNPPAACPADFVPAGLTYRNMMRVGGLSRYERVAARQGQKAALNCAPSVYSTRAGLDVGQVLMFDDLTHDVIVDAGNNVRGVRPQEFTCLDVASAYKLTWGIKAEILKEDGKRERLREREMRYLVTQVLTQIGYRQAGSLWLVEHGTAAIRDVLRKVIKALTRDAITFGDSGILGKQVHEGMWPGAGGGVPGLKAHLEASYNYVHNVTAALPGQTGSNSRLTKPEQLAGLEAYHQELLRIAKKLPEESRRRLMLPVMRLSDFIDEVHGLYRLIHDERDHGLEGWDRNTAHCFRLSPAMEWAPIDATLAAIEDPAKRAAMEAAIATLSERRMIRASRREVWERGARNLARLEHWATVPLLADDERCVRRVKLSRKGEIAFEDAYYGPGVHRYYPVVHTPDGRRELLGDRREYAAILTPYDPARIYVCEPAGLSCLGYCERMVPGSRVDLDGMHALMGKRAEIISMLNEPIQERHADDAAARQALIAHNDAVIAEALPNEAAPSKSADVLAGMAEAALAAGISTPQA
jgi:hypothetical protein